MRDDGLLAGSKEKTRHLETHWDALDAERRVSPWSSSPLSSWSARKHYSEESDSAMTRDTVLDTKLTAGATNQGRLTIEPGYRSTEKVNR